MTATERFPIAEKALAYRQARDTRAKALYRMTMPKLREEERLHLATQGIERLSRGPETKDELVNAILATEYPAALLNEAGHVLYHRPGEIWTACEFCHPHQGEPCECPLRREPAS